MREMASILSHPAPAKAPRDLDIKTSCLYIGALPGGERAARGGSAAKMEANVPGEKK
jgi:hypothetical protein